MRADGSDWRFYGDYDCSTRASEKGKWALGGVGMMLGGMGMMLGAGCGWGCSEGEGEAAAAAEAAPRVVRVTVTPPSGCLC